MDYRRTRLENLGLNQESSDPESDVLPIELFSKEWLALLIFCPNIN